MGRVRDTDRGYLLENSITLFLKSFIYRYSCKMKIKRSQT
jgi:hypothetical protein